MSNRNELYLIVSAAVVLVWAMQADAHEAIGPHQHWMDAAHPVYPQLVVLALVSGLLLVSLRLMKAMSRVGWRVLRKVAAPFTQ